MNATTTEPSCRVCNCTEERACVPPCYWAEPNLCSACVEAEKIPQPVCQGCRLEPEDIEEYQYAGHEEGMTPSNFVRLEEGTLNPENGHFLCTACYIRRGMPSSRKGWVCP